MWWSKTRDGPGGVACLRKRSPDTTAAAYLGCVAVCLALAACGFQLRGSATLPFNTLYVDAPRSSPFALQLRRAIGSGSTTRVTNNPADADATLQVLNEFREQEILSLSPGGRARELQLRYRVQYQVFDRKKAQLLPPSEIVLRRDFSVNDQDPRGQEGEQELLYRDMQADAVQQLVRRLQAAAKNQPRT
ncbi:MAG TPA: LPS assembly lipoprotein LptE [Burkholderiales bacterium]|nr:LPS assembly lipoprotein LptE [Burkholderiales bacterium]